MHSLFLDLSINTLHRSNCLWMPRTTKHSEVLFLCFLIISFPPAENISMLVIAFMWPPFSCMNADTTNNIWGGWRTSDMKIASVLILLSKYRHIFFLITRTTKGEWYWCLLLLLHNNFCNIYPGLLGGGRFFFIRFMYRHFTYRPLHLSWCWGKNICVCFYIYRYMKRKRHIHAFKMRSFLKAHWFNALEWHLLTIQKKGLLWARDMIFIIILLSCVNPIPSPGWSLSKVMLSQVAL